ncbi:tartrate dehydrogenase [bacterium]|nr:tartrate dehydrogenase [bacterium]
MKSYRIASIPGDGVGQEVAIEALKILNLIAHKHSINIEITSFNWGCDYYLDHQCMMPADGLDRLIDFDTIFLGSVGNAKKVPDHISVKLVLDIRKAFDQYINLRPIQLYPGVETLIRTATPESVNMVVVRENTEGEYANMGGFFKQHTADAIAIQTAIFTQKGCERVMRYAFDLAEKRKKNALGPGKVTSCTKSNALGYSMVFWDQVFGDVRSGYPDIKVETALVDALSMWLIRNPERYDVIVASNLFGDILTDLGAMLQGGMGMAAGGNINPEKRYPSMFEPIHGSAPDIAFQGIVNPVASIESIRLMMDFLGETAAAQDIQHAVSTVMKTGRIKTVDLGGSSQTGEVGDEIARILKLDD